MQPSPTPEHFSRSFLNKYMGTNVYLSEWILLWDRHIPSNAGPSWDPPLVLVAPGTRQGCHTALTAWIILKTAQPPLPPSLSFLLTNQFRKFKVFTAWDLLFVAMQMKRCRSLSGLEYTKPLWYADCSHQVHPPARQLIELPPSQLPFSQAAGGCGATNIFVVAKPVWEIPAPTPPVVSIQLSGELCGNWDGSHGTQRG